MIRRVMHTFTTISDWRRFRRSVSGVGPLLFVPTMGALHPGHGHLVTIARQTAGPAGCVCVSIFVNPLQFGPGEDFSRYPRPLENDTALLRQWHTDVLFAPSTAEMYPHGATTVAVDPGPLGEIWEGKLRPGHFRGVCTVVAKLLAIMAPDILILGQKDFQQQLILRRMVRDLNFPVQVLTAPTVREADGLAMSSRNRYLSAQERPRAAAIFEALRFAAAEIRAGRRKVAPLVDAMTETMRRAGLQVDYALPCHPETLAACDDVVTEPCVLLAAGKLGSTRLIDNLLTPDPKPV